MGSTPVASGHKAGITGLALDGTTSETWQLGSASAERWRLSGGTGTSGVFALQNRRGGLWADVWQSVDYGSGLIANAINGMTSLAFNYDAVDAPQNVLTLTANKLTAPIGAGYGVSFTMQAEDSTTEYVGLGGAAWSWTNPVHVSRSSKAVLSVIENAVSVDALTITGTGINATPIGSTTASTGAFTTITASTSLTATAGTSATIPAIVQGYAAQSANLQEWRTSDSVVHACISPYGQIQARMAAGENQGFGGIALYKDGNFILSLATDAPNNYPQINSWKYPLYITAGSGGTRALYLSGTTITFNSTSSVYSMLSTANTSTVENVLTIEKKLSSGSGAAGLGAGINLILQSSTTSSQNAARLVALWNDATHASRKADLVGYASDASAEREIWRGRANGSAAAIGFLGAAPAVQQTGGAQTATGTWTATEQAMLQAAYDALRTFGLLT